MGKLTPKQMEALAKVSRVDQLLKEGDNLFHFTKEGKAILKSGELAPSLGPTTKQAYEGLAEEIGRDLPELTFLGDKPSYGYGTDLKPNRGITIREGLDSSQGFVAKKSNPDLQDIIFRDTELNGKAKSLSGAGSEKTPIQVESTDYYTKEPLAVGEHVTALTPEESLEIALKHSPESNLHLFGKAQQVFLNKIKELPSAEFQAELAKKMKLNPKFAAALTGGAAALGISNTASASPTEQSVSPVPKIQAMSKWFEENVGHPLAEKIHSKLFQNVEVNNQSYATGNEATKALVKMGVDYVLGANPIGEVFQAAQMMGDFAPSRTQRAQPLAQQEGVPVQQEGVPVQQYANGGMVQKLKTEQPMGAEVYDMSSGQPVLGEVPHAQVQEAIASGRFQLPANRDVQVYSPDGTLGTIPTEQAAEAFKAGYKYATPDEARFKGRGLEAGLLGALDTATFGLASAVGPSEARLKLAEQNPEARMVGQVAGLLMPGGAGSLMAKAGEAVAAKAAFNTATAAGRVGSTATKAAIENMVFAGSDEVAKVFMHDPNQSIESAMANVGMAAAIGGGIGGAFGAVPELWKMSAASNKLTGLLDGIKGKAAGEVALPEGITASKEAAAAMSENPLTRKLGASLAGSDTMAGRGVAKGLEAVESQIDNEAAKVFGRDAAAIEALDTSAHQIGQTIEREIKQELRETLGPISKGLNEARDKLSVAEIAAPVKQSLSDDIAKLVTEQAGNPDDAALKYLQTTLSKTADLKNIEQLRGLSKFVGDKMKNYADPNMGTWKQLRGVLKKAEDAAFDSQAEILGPDFATKFKQDLSAYRQHKEPMAELASYLGISRAGKTGTESFIKALEQGLDAGTIADRLAKASPELQDLLASRYPKIAERVKQYQIDTLLEASRKDGALSLEKLTNKIQSMDPAYRSRLLGPEQLDRLKSLAEAQAKIPSKSEMAAAQSAFTKLWNKLPPSAAGIGAMLLGHNPVVAFAVSLVGKEAPDAVKRGMLRFLTSDAPTNAAALKQAMGMASAVEKGERALNNSVKAVFEPKNGTAIKVPDTAKLAELVDKFEADPEKFLSLGADLGHYLPDHASALGAAAVRNVRYLASLKPSTAPLSPLDSMRKVSSTEDAKYDRALQIAQAPLLVLEGVQEGRINPADLQHLHQLYPTLARSMETKLMEQMITSKGKGKQVPYKTQIGLSAFMGQPLSTSLQPQSIQASQPRQVSMEPPMQGKPVRKTSGLPKLGTSYQTPMQSRQAHRGSRH